MEKVITKQAIETFRIWLEKAGKGIPTIQKYLRDLKKLECFLAGNQIDKKQMLAYKKKFWDCGKYKISSINSFLVAANRFLKFMGWYEMIVETYPVQEEIFRSDEKVLIEEECKKLIDLQRKQVWRKKVFPHNFRHLFAHYFY